MPETGNGMLRQIIALILCLLGLAGCAPTGGFLVSDEAQALGGNLFVEKLADGGRVMVLDGEIDLETAFVFRSFLAQVQANGLVIAQSPGGNVEAAHQIGRAIKSRQMNTLVLNSCNSACVDVFVAGKQREMTDIAELGLHAPAVRSWISWLPFVDTRPALEATYAVDQKYWSDMGFPLVNEKAYQVPNNRIWIITPERARELRLATKILTAEN